MKIKIISKPPIKGCPETHLEALVGLTVEAADRAPAPTGHSLAGKPCYVVDVDAIGSALRGAGKTKEGRFWEGLNPYQAVTSFRVLIPVADARMVPASRGA